LASTRSPYRLTPGGRSPRCSTALSACRLVTGSSCSCDRRWNDDDNGGRAQHPPALELVAVPAV